MGDGEREAVGDGEILGSGVAVASPVSSVGGGGTQGGIAGRPAAVGATVTVVSKPTTSMNVDPRSKAISAPDLS